jgi:hypothetical protein
MCQRLDEPWLLQGEHSTQITAIEAYTSDTASQIATHLMTMPFLREANRHPSKPTQKLNKRSGRQSNVVHATQLSNRGPIQTTVALKSAASAVQVTICQK